MAQQKNRDIETAVKYQQGKWHGDMSHVTSIDLEIDYMMAKFTCKILPTYTCIIYCLPIINYTSRILSSEREQPCSII